LCRFKAAIEIGPIKKSEGGDKFMLEESMSFGDLPLEIHYSILDLDTHKVKVMFRIVVKDQLLKNKLHGDIDNAENQVFEE